MNWRPVTGVLAIALGVGSLAAACDFQPLTGRDLFGLRGADGGQDLPVDSVVEQETSPPGDGGGDGGDGGDGVVADGTGSDGALMTCAVECSAAEFCDELSGRCVSRTGNSMLSGVVRDKCTGMGIDALVGIAGRHQCSPPGKGSFFFTQLPVGKLKLAAAKTGYRLFDTTVVIAPGGTIQDVDLMPATANGCADPPPAQVMCVCTGPQCQP